MTNHTNSQGENVRWKDAWFQQALLLKRVMPKILSVVRKVRKNSEGNSLIVCSITCSVVLSITCPKGQIVSK